jgi:hypothetical protein
MVVKGLFICYRAMLSLHLLPKIYDIETILVVNIIPVIRTAMIT